MLAIAHGLWRGGAQEATLEMLSLLRKRDIDISVLTCEKSERAFLSDLENLGISTLTAPEKIVANYADGVLTVALPKLEVAKEKPARAIEVA